MKKATLTFHGAVGGPTGSNFLFETEKDARNDSSGTNILIDCGFFQGCKICEDENRQSFPYDPKTIDALFITHAHIDHVGRIPLLVKAGFKGKIYSTPPTRDLARVMLMDSIGVLLREARRAGQPLVYEEKDVDEAMKYWEGIPYHEEVNIKNEVRAELFDSGHILGSAMIALSYGEKKILFTGDLGNSPAPLLRDTEIVESVNYLLVESIYGDRNHEDRGRRKEILEDVIEETIKRKGVVVIPAFSLERTQELLYEINDLVEHGRIPSIPIFLDSPLAIKVTDIYKKYEEYFNSKTRDIIKSGDDIFKFPLLRFTLKTEESKAIADVPPPKIIIAGSGMSNGGRVIHHEKKYLPDPNNALLLIGYQAAGTPGRQFQEGAKNVRIFGDEIAVKARVVTIHGYSAHKDANGLFDFVDAMKDSLEKVFVAIGEPRSSLYLTQRIRDYLGLHAEAPLKKGDKVELEF